MLDETIGERIHRLRADRGWETTKLAAEAGVVAMTVWRWETDRRMPDAESLPRLAAALGCSTDFILTGAEHGDA